MESKYIPFDPSKHEGKQLFEIQSARYGQIIKTIVVPSMATFDEAQRAPYFYLVEAIKFGELKESSVIVIKGSSNKKSKITVVKGKSPTLRKGA